MPAELTLYPKAPAENIQRVADAYRRMLESGDLAKDALLRLIVNAPRPDRPLFVWMLTHDGEPVGEVSIFNVDFARSEVGIVMTPKCPKWLGASTFMKTCHWAYSTLGVQRLEAYVRVTNAHAVRIAKKFGFKQEGVLRHAVPTVNDKLEDVIVFGLLKDEFYEKWGGKNGSGDSIHHSSSVDIRGHSTVSNGKAPRRGSETTRARGSD